MNFFPLIYVNAFAKLVQFVGCAPVVVAEIVKMNPDAEVMKHPDAVHHINGSTIIGGPWHIQAYNM
jgi:hypothetical protein